MANFASRLKELRLEQGTSQADLGTSLNMGRTTIANYEQDIRFPDQNTLCKLANYFDVSLDYLLGRSNSRTNIHFNVFKKNHSVMLIIDPVTGEIIDFSAAALDFYGYSKDELLQKKITEINTLSQEEVSKEMHRATDENRKHFFFKHRLSSGEIKDVEVYSGPIHLEGKLYLYSIVRDITDRSNSENRLIHIFQSTVSNLLHSKSPYKINHEKRVSQLAMAIAKKLGLGPDEVRNLELAAITHDIGSVHIPTEILNRPGPLRDIEIELVKKHPIDSYKFLEEELQIKIPIADIVLQHHERLDGSGYPYGLRGEEILFESRILAVADVVEAMTCQRPYRPAQSINVALQELLDQRGIKYDPQVVDACIELFRENNFSFDNGS